MLDTAICRHPVQRLSCHPLHSHLAMRIGAMWTANPDRFPRNSRLVDLGFCDLSEKWDEQVSWFGETNAMKSHRNMQPRTNSHASSTTSYTAKNPTQRQSSTAAMNKNSNEPKCAFANTPHNSASNSYPSQQIQQLRKLVPEECASSEGWHEQWVEVPPGQKSKPRSLNSRKEGN